MRYLLLLAALLTFQSVNAFDFDDTKVLADQGYAKAQSNLGLMYADGEGVPENNIHAYVWWSMAKTQSHEYAKVNLEILKPQMTKQQIAEAQSLAAQCYESDYKDCD